MVTSPCLMRQRSFLLRVMVGRGKCRYFVQDLRTGERREFTSERDFHGFLAEVRPMRLR